MDTAAEAPPPSDVQRAPRFARVLLDVVAGIETASALSSVPILFGPTPDSIQLAGVILTLSIALRPVFAVAALVAVLRGRLRFAVTLLAAATLVQWADMLGSVAQHGLDWEGAGDTFSSAHFLLTPVPALAAMFLAWKRLDQIAMAAILVSLGTLIDVLSVVAFAVSVGIWGF